MTTAEFILLHLDDDTSRLLLSMEKWPEVDMELAVNTIESRRKLRTKLPSWYAVPELLYPRTLSAEQCSGEEAAVYKSALCRAIFRLQRQEPASDDMAVADLTGGLGVDSWAFSKVAGKVLYNEMDPALCAAARHNFELLGAGNVIVRNETVAPGGIEKVLGGFVPDIIFLDPARRNGSGGKVFRLEDCSPNVLELQEELSDACRHILLKISPMADISLVTGQLRSVREVHVVGSGGECKELLLWLDREWDGDYSVNVDGRFSFTPGEEAEATALFDSPKAGQMLFEPGKALAKSGAFKLISSRFALTKPAPSTHLYTGARIPEELEPLGKSFVIEEILPFGKAGLKKLSGMLPQGRAEVSAHNLQITSEEVKKRLRCKSGGDIHVFAASSLEGPLLIIGRRKANSSDI